MNQHFFFRHSDLPAFALKQKGSGLNTNWLFVTIDSCRENLNKIADSISAKLTENNVSYQWSESGLWLQSSDVVKPSVLSEVIVPFSSAYLFNEQPQKLLQPSFNKTTDSGDRFTNEELSACFDEIDRIGALGYVADGAGLQGLSVDDSLSKCFSKLV